MTALKKAWLQYVEPEAIFLSACEGRTQSQTEKGRRRNSKFVAECGIDYLYSDRLNLSLFERLQLRQIDPPRRPCQFGNGAPRSEREQSSLRFGFVSSVQKGTNSTDPSIAWMD